MKKMFIYIIFSLFVNLKTYNGDYTYLFNNLDFSKKEELDLFIYKNYQLVLDICKEDTENKILPKEQKIILNSLANQQKEKFRENDEYYIKNRKENEFNEKMQVSLILGSGLIGVGLFFYIIKRIFDCIQSKKEKNNNNNEEVKVIKN